MTGFTSWMSSLWMLAALVGGAPALASGSPAPLATCQRDVTALSPSGHTAALARDSMEKRRAFREKCLGPGGFLRSKAYRRAVRDYVKGHIDGGLHWHALERFLGWPNPHEIIYGHLKQLFDPALLSVSHATPADAEQAVQKLAELQERVKQSPSEYLEAVRELREIDQDPDLRETFLEMIRETLPGAVKEVEADERLSDALGDLRSPWSVGSAVGSGLAWWGTVTIAVDGGIGLGGFAGTGAAIYPLINSVRVMAALFSKASGRLKTWSAIRRYRGLQRGKDANIRVLGVSVNAREEEKAPPRLVAHLEPEADPGLDPRDVEATTLGLAFGEATASHASRVHEALALAGSPDRLAPLREALQRAKVGARNLTRVEAVRALAEPLSKSATSFQKSRLELDKLRLDGSRLDAQLAEGIARGETLRALYLAEHSASPEGPEREAHELRIERLLEREGAMRAMRTSLAALKTALDKVDAGLRDTAQFLQETGSHLVSPDEDRAELSPELKERLLRLKQLAAQSAKR